MFENWRRCRWIVIESRCSSRIKVETVAVNIENCDYKCATTRLSTDRCVDDSIVRRCTRVCEGLIHISNLFRLDTQVRMLVLLAGIYSAKISTIVCVIWHIWRQNLSNIQNDLIWHALISIEHCMKLDSWWVFIWMMIYVWLLQPLYGHSQIDSPKVHYMKDVGLFARYEGVVDLGALALSTTHCSSMPTTSRFIISGSFSSLLKLNTYFL